MTRIEEADKVRSCASCRGTGQIVFGYSIIPGGGRNEWAKRPCSDCYGTGDRSKAVAAIGEIHE